MAFRPPTTFVAIRTLDLASRAKCSPDQTFARLKSALGKYFRRTLMGAVEDALEKRNGMRSAFGARDSNASYACQVSVAERGDVSSRIERVGDLRRLRDRVAFETRTFLAFAQVSLVSSGVHCSYFRLKKASVDSLSFKSAR